MWTDNERDDDVVVVDDEEIRTCPDCGEPWVLTKQNREWFTSMHLTLPKRCEPCRLARRAAR
jgi:hypothetical protein